VEKENKMSEDTHIKNRVPVQTHSLSGMVWFIGWLFTIAFAKLSFWTAVLGLLIWPYYLGLAVR
jgi:hypothetical protein